MSARNLLLLATCLALGFGLGWLCAPSGNRREATESGDTVLLEAILDRLERLELAQGRERQGALLQQAAPPAEHEEQAGTDRVAMESAPALAPETLAVPPAISEELAALSAAIESLREGMAERGLSARFPTLEMLRAAPETNVSELEALYSRAYAGSDPRKAMEESVRWMSQDEVLGRYGRPSQILSDGHWLYRLQRHAKDNRYVSFDFVENYVTGVLCGGS